MSRAARAECILGLGAGLFFLTLFGLQFAAVFGRAFMSRRERRNTLRKFDLFFFEAVMLARCTFFLFAEGFDPLFGRDDRFAGALNDLRFLFDRTLARYQLLFDLLFLAFEYVQQRFVFRKFAGDFVAMCFSF